MSPSLIEQYQMALAAAEAARLRAEKLKPGAWTYKQATISVLPDGRAQITVGKVGDESTVTLNRDTAIRVACQLIKVYGLDAETPPAPMEQIVSVASVESPAEIATPGGTG